MLFAAALLVVPKVLDSGTWLLAGYYWDNYIWGACINTNTGYFGHLIADFSSETTCLDYDSRVESRYELE